MNSSTREFTCTWPPRPENMPDPPENLTGNDTSDGSSLNFVTSSSKELPKTRRPKMSGPTVLTAKSKISRSLPICTPHEPSVKNFKAIWPHGCVPSSLPTYQYKLLWRALASLLKPTLKFSMGADAALRRRQGPGKECQNSSQY